MPVATIRQGRRPAAARPRRGFLTVSPIALDPNGKPHAVRLTLTMPDEEVWLDIPAADLPGLLRAIVEVLPPGRIGLVTE